MEKILVNYGKKCTGCTACANKCPKKAIEMKEDEFGFIRAFVDKEKCIQCGLCERRCPQIRELKHNIEEPECYAVWADEKTKNESSSGGVFSILASYVLEQDGVVCGAAYNSDFSVVHMCIENSEDLRKIQKSKYMQSNIRDSYENIEQYLESGRVVLFSGTPCQVAGLNTFLEKDYENLFTLDLICKGVPSYKIFKESIENVNWNEIESIDFRDKEYGWNADHLVIKFKDGSKRVLSTKQSVDTIGTNGREHNWYSEAFLQGYICNEACDDCKFAQIPRQADITIGDFWGIWDIDYECFNKQGVSLLLTNTNKGRRLFDSVKNKLEKCEKKSVELVKNRNRFVDKLNHSVKRKRFVDLCRKQNVLDAIKITSGGNYDVAIVGTPSVRNQGAALLCYALYSFITNAGYAVLMVGHPMDAIWKPNMEFAAFKYNPYPEYAISKIYPRKRSMKELNDFCKMFLLSSDQLLYKYFYEQYGKCFNLDWTYEHKKRIAYGACFSVDKLVGADTEKAEMKRALKRFDYFSVREDEGLKIANEEIGIGAVRVVDPVFLMDKSFYDNLSDKIQIDSRLKSAFTSFIWHPSKEKMEAIISYAKSNELKYVNITENGRLVADMKMDYGELVGGTTVEEWLAYIRDAQFIVTDSFHVACLSIIYHKEFIVIASDAPSRIKSLMSLVHLENRVCYSSVNLRNFIEESMETSINYELVDVLIEDKIAYSREWLLNSLAAEKKQKAISGYDILDTRCDNIMKVLNENEIPKIEKRMEEENLELKKEIAELRECIMNLQRKMEESE